MSRCGRGFGVMPCLRKAGHRGQHYGVLSNAQHADDEDLVVDLRERAEAAEAKLRKVEQLRFWKDGVTGKDMVYGDDLREALGVPAMEISDRAASLIADLILADAKMRGDSPEVQA